VQTVAILPLTGDRGLAGAFNAQIVRRALQLEREVRAEGADVRWVVVGKKGRSTLRFRRYEIEQAWVDFTDRPVYADAVAIARTLADLFVEREVDRVVMVYNHYVSPLTQTVSVEDVLPIPRTLLEEMDLLKRNQRLTFAETITFKQLRLTSYEQIGDGVLPFHYWVDERHRVLFVLSGQRSYIYDPDARNRVKERTS
jgi:ATP synthase F1 gamma subunit